MFPISNRPTYFPAYKNTQPKFKGLEMSKQRDPNDPYWDIHEGVEKYKGIVQKLKAMGDIGHATLRAMMAEGFEWTTMSSFFRTRTGKSYNGNIDQFVADLTLKANRDHFKQLVKDLKEKEDFDAHFALL